VLFLRPYYIVLLLITADSNNNVNIYIVLSSLAALQSVGLLGTRVGTPFAFIESVTHCRHLLLLLSPKANAHLPSHRGRAAAKE